MRFLLVSLAVMVIMVCFAAPTMSKPLSTEKTFRSVLRRSAYDTSSTFSSASSTLVDVDMAQSQIDAFLLASETMFNPTETPWTQANLQDACRTSDSVTGVTGCTSTGFPTGLSLYRSSSGDASTYTLSPDLGALSELASLELDLSSVNFVGTLPAAWSTLTKLENLTIYSSSLGGASLPEDWSGMTSLQRIWIDLASTDTPATGTAPSWVSALKFVYLGYVSIGPSNDLPESWFTSNSITELYLYHVYCSGLVPSSVTSNTVLQVLWVATSGSVAPAMPSDLSAMTSLKWACLNGFADSLPSKYPSSLEKVCFSGVSITGTIPQSLFDCPNLSFIELSDLSVHGDLPAPSSPLTSKLESIEARSLQLNGTISNDYFYLPNFKEFSAIQLEGLSPASFGALPTAGECGMTKFECVNCSISGSIPSDLLTACPHLEVISLPNNYLTGSLPEALFATNASSLTYIWLDGNYLTGNLPETIGFQQKVTLYLSNNYLTGTIPMGWDDKLNGVRLDGNSLDLCGAPENTGNFTEFIPTGCIIAPQYGYDYCTCSSIWSTSCQSTIPCDGSPLSPTALPPYELPPFTIPTPSTTVPVTSPDQQPSVTPSPPPNGVIPSLSPSSIPSSPVVDTPSSTPSGTVEPSSTSPPTARVPEPSNAPSIMAPTLVAVMCAVLAVTVM